MKEPPGYLTNPATNPGEGEEGSRTPYQRLADGIRPLRYTSDLARELGIVRPTGDKSRTREARLASLSDRGRRFDTRLGALAARVAALGDVLTANTGRAAAATASSSKSRAGTSLGVSARLGLERRTAVVVNARVRDAAAVLRAAAAAAGQSTHTAIFTPYRIVFIKRL